MPGLVSAQRLRLPREPCRNRPNPRHTLARGGQRGSENYLDETGSGLHGRSPTPPADRPDRACDRRRRVRPVRTRAAAAGGGVSRWPRRRSPNGRRRGVRIRIDTRATAPAPRPSPGSAADRARVRRLQPAPADAPTGHGRAANRPGDCRGPQTGKEAAAGQGRRQVEGGTRRLRSAPSRAGPRSRRSRRCASGPARADRWPRSPPGRAGSPAHRPVPPGPAR